jgi:hypothetical protein
MQASTNFALPIWLDEKKMTKLAWQDSPDPNNISLNIYK